MPQKYSVFRVVPLYLLKLLPESIDGFHARHKIPSSHFELEQIVFLSHRLRQRFKVCEFLLVAVCTQLIHVQLSLQKLNTPLNAFHTLFAFH